MNKVKNTDSEEQQIMSTMQDLSSTVSFTPSFSFYASGDLVEAAVRVVKESDDSYYSVKLDGENDADFEFETLQSSFRFPTTIFKFSSDDDYVADDRVTSESEDSGNMSPSRCFWSPIRSPARVDSSKKKKSKSLSKPRQCCLKEFLLRRSHSDGAVSTSSTPKRCSFKDLLRRSHSDGGQVSTISPSGSGSPVVKGRNKTVPYKPEVDIRRKSYLPYRQDLIGVFAGMSRFRH